MGMRQVAQRAGHHTPVEAVKTIHAHLVRLFSDRFAIPSSRRPRLDIGAMPKWHKRDLGLADGQDWRIGDDLFR